MADDRDLGAWNTRTADHLRTVAERVASAPPPKLLGEVTIALKNLEAGAEAAIARLVAPLDGDRDRCIYTIDAAPDVDIPALRAAFGKAQEQNALLREERSGHPDAYRLPQDNKRATSTCLYVGSSCATQVQAHTLKSRLKQHLVKAHKGTYALNLARWAGGEPGSIVLRAYQYPAAADGTDESAREIVLAVEDWLSSERMPIFGRRGSRN